MTLSELLSEVYTLTNRPDLVAQTTLAVRAATLKIHQSDYFFRDIFETGINFGAAGYVQQLEPALLIPRWRAFKYLRKTDSTGAENGDFFELIVPEHSLNGYGTTRSDVCYAAGAVIQIRSSTSFQYAIHGCYLNPDIAVSSYTSWVADMHPYAIVFEAAAAVFKMVGDTEQFAAYTKLAEQYLSEVKLSNIHAKGE